MLDKLGQLLLIMITINQTKQKVTPDPSQASYLVSYHVPHESPSCRLKLGRKCIQTIRPYSPKSQYSYVAPQPLPGLNKTYANIAP